MTEVYLQAMLDNIQPSDLSTNWKSFDLQSFSRKKNLWDCQQIALNYAIKALWKYYRDPNLTVSDRKENYYQWYLDFGLDQNLDIPVDKSSVSKRQLAALQETYYNVVNDKISYDQFINSICFWMATGSGKSLVIVKIIEILHELIKRGEIPNHDILVLAHRDDLLKQLSDHISEFNTTGNLFIRLHELRDYSEVKRAQPNLYAKNERTIFYYRSDNLSDEQKEKIIDFRNYDNEGHWYVFLDEAHKGDRESAKRQQIYAIMSRNGFLFNFSATFTDQREIITTAYNFNLSEFIPSGYGKHIYIFDQETTAFRQREDFSISQKQKIVLKTLILLTHIRQTRQKVQTIHSDLYHSPLMMALVNSVNKEDADLKLLFRELAKISKGEIDDAQWQSAKEELIREIASEPSFIYESSIRLKIERANLESITQTDILQSIFNSKEPGQIEILLRPSDRKEIAFKLKTSEDAFALIRIGDVSNWLTNELRGYEINHSFADEGFFERLNQPTSSINILLGSRSFYEGWDSNRPNVIMYINIGMGTDAKKFILQSVGRGARIEPLPGYHKRFNFLKAGEKLSEEESLIFNQVKKDILPLESEFIFGTNRDALQTVIEELEQEDRLTGSREISLRKNEERVGNKLLLIPVFKQQDKLLYHQRYLAKFPVSEESLNQLQNYLSYIDDDRLLLALYDISPKQIERIRTSIENTSNHYKIIDEPNYKNISVLVRQVNKFLALYGKEFDKFTQLEDEINHYKHIRVILPDVEFAKFEVLLEKFYEKPKKKAELEEKLSKGQITNVEELLRETSVLNTPEKYSYRGKEVTFKHIQEHFYFPIIVSDGDRETKLDYLRNVIDVPSEIRFLEHLERALHQDGNPFGTYDWWLFSRIDEVRDFINIPYYYSYENRIANFRPDFIFWMQRGNDYHILFVDPKGTSRTEYQLKVDGFRDLFERDEKPILFKYGELNVKVWLFLYTEDIAWPSDYYRRYWMDNPSDMINSIE